jgi:FixJ family two-component response regulator
MSVETVDKPLVIVIDDDQSVREALDSLIRSVGLGVLGFSSAEEYRGATLPDRPGCIILDVRMPRQSGLELQRELVGAGETRPMIFITAHGDITMSVRAMKAGAIEFLPKPFRDQDLLDAIELGISRHREDRRRAAALAELKARLRGLTPREREVMEYVVSGRLNKQIAAALQLSEITVKAHRGQVMRKMQAKSVAELVRMADKLGVSLPPRGSN